MDFVDGPVPLGEWLPDFKDLKFPNLAVATNVEPIGTVYKSFEPLDNFGLAVPGDFIRGCGKAVLNGVTYVYAGSSTGIYMSTGLGAFSARATSTVMSAQADFLQFEDLEVVALANPPLYHTVGSASNFATISSLTRAQRVGKINKFLIFGDTNSGESHMQWSGIDAPLSWPTPNSSTAIAQQSGEQYLDNQFGPITGFSNGDQFGLVFQTTAITRVTYVGPPVVFQFDRISTNIGCSFPRSIVQVGPLTYFRSDRGFHRTDGVNIEDIGKNKVDEYFTTLHLLTGAAGKEYVRGAYNQYKDCVFWSFSDDSLTPSDNTGVFIFNCKENRFSMARQTLGGLLSTNGFAEFNTTDPAMFGFGGGNTLGAFRSGTTAGLASLETGDIEFNPGGFSHLSGAKLLVDQTAGAVVGYSKIRNELVSAQLTASAASTATAATGFSDFRREARYHRLLFTVAGEFNQAQAMEFKALKSGSR